MKKIALITNFNIADKVKAALLVAKALEKEDCEILLASFNRDKLEKIHEDRENFRYLPLDHLYEEADVAIVLGGDGSILEVARRAAPRGLPILGINLGRLGYMAELEMGELDLLHRLFTEEYEVEERSMLKVELLSANGELKSFCHALNDAVISNGSVSRIIDMELSSDDAVVSSYRADGLIIATPTGSTAYSLSAGGTVVDPAVPCVCVTPICPHSMTTKPLIFPNSAVLQVKNTCVREKMLYLTVDGKLNFELYRNQFVRITKSPLKTQLIRFKKSSFYKKLCQKMQKNYF